MEAELRVKTATAAVDFLSRHVGRHHAEMGVSKSVRADVVTCRMQRTNLIPRHPFRLNALFLVPPRNMVGADPFGGYEETRSLVVAFEYRCRNGSVADVAVVEGDREAASQLLSL